MSTNMYLKAVLNRNLAESKAQNEAGWSKYREDQQKWFEYYMRNEHLMTKDNVTLSGMKKVEKMPAEEEPNMWTSLQSAAKPSTQREFSRIWEWRAPSLRVLFGIDYDPRADIDKLETKETTRETQIVSDEVSVNSSAESDSEASDSGISSSSSVSTRKSHLKPVRAVKIDSTEVIEKRKEIVTEWMKKIKESMA